MFEQIGDGLGAHCEMRIDALRVDGRAVAMAVSCGHDRTWWLWKVAYDEGFSAYSPGVLLLLDITERAISEGKGEHYDSCALPGIALVERVWRQRRPYRDLLIAPARLGRYGRTTALGLEASRRLAEASAKKALKLLGRR